MRQALHQGSLTCRRVYRRVVEYACGTRPSPVDSRSARNAIGAGNGWASDFCWIICGRKQLETLCSSVMALCAVVLIGVEVVKHHAGQAKVSRTDPPD